MINIGMLRNVHRASRSDQSSFTEDTGDARRTTRPLRSLPSQLAGGPPVVIAKRWRERLTYLAMSLVVGWHSLAIIIAPAPDSSGMAQTLRFLLQPYLSLFRLDNQWNFFAPSPGRHLQFRYVVEDAAGKRHVFIPVDEASGSVPRYVMWREFKYLYEGVMEAPEIRSEPIGALLCRRHASLNPVSVSLLQVQELDFSPADYLQGHRPLDPDFVAVDTLANVKC